MVRVYLVPDRKESLLTTLHITRPLILILGRWIVTMEAPAIEERFCSVSSATRKNESFELRVVLV